MRMGIAERRHRLARRHLLAPSVRVSSVTEVADGMVALHGTDPSTVYLSAWARMTGGSVDAVEKALYDDRTVVRLLGMRRTVFVIPTELAPVVLAACSRAVAARERKQLLSWLRGSAVAPDVEAWLDEVERVALRALTGLGEATAAELSEADPRLRTELVLAAGKNYEGKVRVGSRVLLLLAATGHVVRCRPLGSWTSTQFRWSAWERWCGGELPVLSTEDASVSLARSWLRRFGPATVEDLRWWAGWTVTQTRAALSALPVAEVDLDGVPGVALADDLAPGDPVEPWVALLPALDPTPMGWNRRDFYLGPHGAALFDRTGNVSPTVWCDGRVVGGWAQRKDGTVVHRLLEDVGAEAAAAIESSAAELSGRLGPVRLTARARATSPVERELLG
jgi:hypothetical protein